MLCISIVWTLLPGKLSLSGGAVASSPWLGTNALTLTNLGELPLGEVAPTTINGNIDCTEQTLTLRPEQYGVPPFQPVLQTATATDACVIETAYGVVDTRMPYIQMDYSDTAGLAKPAAGSLGLLGVPNSPLMLGFTSSGYVQIFRSIISKLTPIFNPTTHELSYTIDSPPDFVLADVAHNSLLVNYDSVSFSANGRWMVINSPGHALLRVNLSSFEVLPIGLAFDYNTGIGPNPQTAITNDGRYVVAGSSSFRTLRLYDATSCASPPAVITGPLDCQYRDMWSVLAQNLSGFTSISTLRFVDNDILSLYAGSRPSSGASINVAKYNLTTAGHSTSQLNYLALGDSISSGEGAYHYRAGTDTTNNMCHLSNESFPYLIAARTDSNSFHSVACSGARIVDIQGSADSYIGQVGDKLPLNQRDSDDILHNFTPGMLPQSDFVKYYAPQNMTLNISGNDINFSDIIKECITDVLRPTCYDSFEDRLELYQTINNQESKLTALYKQLKRDAAPVSRVYAIGYPQLVFPNGNCAVNVHLNAREVDLAVSLIDQLNAMIKASATSAGVAFIDVSDALVGHRLCETKSSNVAVNGLTLGNDIPGFLHGPIANESYHPNTLGHRLLEAAILAATHNLTLGMPVKKTTKASAAKSNKGLTGSATTGRKLKKVIPTKAAPKAIKRKQTTTIAHKNTVAKTSHKVSLGGQNLGAFTADENGTLAVTITIPDTTPIGYIPINIEATGPDGDTQDLHEVIYVSDDPGSSTGTTNSNNHSTCIVVPSSGQDVDQDGVDDACDDFIGEPPITINTTGSSNATGVAPVGEDAEQPQAHDIVINTGFIHPNPTNTASHAYQNVPIDKTAKTSTNPPARPAQAAVLGLQTSRPTSDTSTLPDHHNPRKLTKQVLASLLLLLLIFFLVCFGWQHFRQRKLKVWQ